jgi:hypothetical protein
MGKSVHNTVIIIKQFHYFSTVCFEEKYVCRINSYGGDAHNKKIKVKEY